MSGSTLETATDFRSFKVEVPKEELADLRRRIAATSRPEHGTVTDQATTFAAWQEPELFTNELRAAFRSPRMNGGHA